MRITEKQLRKIVSESIKKTIIESEDYWKYEFSTREHAIDACCEILQEEIENLTDRFGGDVVEECLAKKLDVLKRSNVEFHKKYGEPGKWPEGFDINATKFANR